MQPIKNPTVAFTGPYGSITSADLLKERFRGPGNAPSRLLDERRDFLVPGQGEPLLVGVGPEFLDCLCRDLDLLRADLPAGLAGGAGEQAVPDRIGDPVAAVPGIEGETHLLPHRGRAEELRHVHGRADRDAAEALDAVLQRFDRVDVGLLRETRSPSSAGGRRSVRAWARDRRRDPSSRRGSGARS